MDAPQGSKNSSSFITNQANSFIVSSGASTGANTKSGKTATNQFMSVPSDGSHGSGLLIKEQTFD